MKPFSRSELISCFPLNSLNSYEVGFTAFVLSLVMIYTNRQLYDLKKEIDKNILITNMNDQNKISGTFLDIDYAFEN